MIVSPYLVTSDGKWRCPKSPLMMSATVQSPQEFPKMTVDNRPAIKCLQQVADVVERDHLSHSLVKTKPVLDPISVTQAIRASYSTSGNISPGESGRGSKKRLIWVLTQFKPPVVVLEKGLDEVANSKCRW